MKPKNSLRALALILSASSALLVSTPAAAQATHGGAHGGSPAMAAPSTSSAPKPGAGAMDMMSVMKESNQQMTSMPMTGKPDVDFAMMMRMHHMAGTKMAEIELRDGKDAKMRDAAKKIIASQKKEIAEFEAFLAKNGHDMSKMAR